jgi:hypothetical protein
MAASGALTLKKAFEILIFDGVMTIPVRASRCMRLSGREGKW